MTTLHPDGSPCAVREAVSSVNESLRVIDTARGSAWCQHDKVV
jgi:hypothetical protein